MSKNRCRKYRFFALFRRAFRDVPFGSSVVSWALSSSLIFSPCLSNLPEKYTKSELFAGFFSPCLSKFTQTSCIFQARNRKSIDSARKKPLIHHIPAALFVELSAQQERAWRETRARSKSAPDEKPVYSRRLARNPCGRSSALGQRAGLRAYPLNQRLGCS